MNRDYKMFEFLRKNMIKRIESNKAADNINQVSLEENYWIDEKKLLNSFDMLNAFLEQEDISIKIDITKFGSKEYTYKLDFRNKSLILELQLNEFIFKMIINPISEIEIATLGNQLKIHIKYLYINPFDKKRRVLSDNIRCYFLNVNNPKTIRRCNTKNYEREEKEFEKYINTDPLRYNVGKTIDKYTFYMNGKILSKKDYTLKNNASKYCLLFIQQDNSFDVYYIDEKGERKIVLLELKYNDELKIIDVLPLPVNEGIGTNAFNLIFEYINCTQKISKMYGSLSSVDDDHADRRDRFYRKLGFKIDSMRISRTFEKSLKREEEN